MAQTGGSKSNPNRPPRPPMHPLRVARKFAHRAAFEEFVRLGPPTQSPGDLLPGQEFYVGSSHVVMGFGSGRREPADGDRPAILLRNYDRDVWLGLPGTSHNMSRNHNFYGTTPSSYSYWSVPAPAGSYFFCHYEVIPHGVLYRLKGKLKDDTFRDMRFWLQDRFFPRP